MLGGFCSQQFCRLVTTIRLHHTENNYKKVMNFLKFVKVRARFTENNLSSKTSQVALVVKNVPAKAGDIRDVGLTNRGQEDPLEEGVATHSRIPAWRIPRTEEPGALQSAGSHRVGCNWSDLTHMHKTESGTGLGHEVHLSQDRLENMSREKNILQGRAIKHIWHSSQIITCTYLHSDIPPILEDIKLGVCFRFCNGKV